MNRRTWKIVLLWTGLGIFIFLFMFALIFKLTNAYRPSIYNYEAYLSPTIINKLKKNYNYKEFKEINEFTQALVQDKAIAGVGSDFQAAQLILDKKIKKIDFSKLYGSKELSSWNKRKNLFTDNIQNHLEKFDELIYSKIEQMKDAERKIKGFEINTVEKKWRMIEKNRPSNDWDHFYDFVIPYYVQDKGIAYNFNKDSRPHLDLNTPEIQTLEEKSTQLDWFEIFSTLKKHNFKRVAWTNAYVDNLMIGVFNYMHKHPTEWKKVFTKNGNDKLLDFNESNYRIAIDSFVSFVKAATDHSIKNTQYNFISSNGLELLNHLIEPKPSRSDSGVIYNGDALDAYYSEDNFASVKNGNIRFIRPKNNFILVDCWIISNKLDNKDTDNFLKMLGDNIYRNNHRYSTKYSKKVALDNLEKDFIQKMRTKLTPEEFQKAKEIIKNIYENNKDNLIDNLKLLDPSIDWEKLENWTKEIDNFEKNTQSTYFISWLKQIRNDSEEGYSIFEEAFENLFNDIEFSEIANFNYISYTPADDLTFSFIYYWYFGNDGMAKQIYSVSKSDPSYQLFNYPIIDNNLRTKISAYYFETTKS
ncbi:hypothetical protein [Mycoplasma enhydrae]|uniref:hypothetical protein n=1 Tax=Mycoplasma enhydrae TaxID=2499220 RepID=UPI00197B40F9|nr:hypothetical protein [Mycoplasma enhydrae]MBN4089627.1 hypothetical protein [Mycoplasma enhydrae]